MDRIDFSLHSDEALEAVYAFCDFYEYPAPVDLIAEMEDRGIMFIDEEFYN